MSLNAFLPRIDGVREGLLSRYVDLLLVAGVIAIVALMVLPLPLWLIDLLVAANIASGIVLLLVAMYIAGPTEFAVFPSLLLITTLFRLALSIATTRQILLHADGGHIIDTFGKLVAGGNLVVGLVVFIIITVVQFIVIAKGAERVAEVAARFSLDAMPGKQLSIDSDLRSGLIDKDEAKRKRRHLELESKLHGSLDGAMKFVKGDAIAGIVIIAVNLIGGLAVGVLQQELAVGQALHTYSILSIGEGMVAQIPALLGAMAAGLIVTRTADEDERHLGDAIRRQLGAKPRVLVVGGGVCVLFSLVPGFPAPVFLLLAAVMLGSGLLLMPQWQRRVERWRSRALPARRVAPPPAVQSAPATQLPPALPLLLLLPAPALQGDAGRQLGEALGRMAAEFQLYLGVPLPRIALHGRGPEHGNGWQLLVYETPVASGAQPGGPDADAALAESLRQVLRRNAPLFVGIQETTAMLTQASTELPDVVKEVLRALPIQRVADVLRRLVAEEISIRNLRDVLESLAETGQREKDVQTLTEFARIALKRQTSHRVAPDGHLRCLMLSPALEDTVRQGIRVSGGTAQLAIDPQQAQQIAGALVQAIRSHGAAAIVTAVDVRWHLRRLIEADAFDTPVLSFHELMPSLRLEVVERVDLPELPMLRAA
ncbi:FHIPEP family type III secretion protein [Pelomonas sp. CA6]|uniref:FHIPEP family type III secretion protein n=1 Tax=Pelomonas sp. CA6 TaxID=2907999 RepID=UPI001F4BD639|nr:FHIPEP family type III secretion protein [Pelomonas sp. CA6]MCH7345084.1 FHIPEP family type III secretion protein [Pelomonas sp. CA6]